MFDNAGSEDGIVAPEAPIALGKPADAGEKILERRLRLTRRTSWILNRGGRLLDVGCGNGALTELYAPHFSHTVGADIQASLMKGAGDYASWTCAVGEHLPFEDASFDGIICFEVLEHVQDPEAVVREFHRVLKPGGQAVISVPNKWWVFETHGAYLPGLPWNRVPFFSWLPDPLHRRWAKARIYTRRRFHTLLARGGFTNIAMHYITAPMDRAKPPWLQHALQRTVFAPDETRNPFIAISHLAVVTRGE